MRPQSVNCFLCEMRHSKKMAHAWCSICQKGFCNKCRYSHLSSRKNRGHQFISVEKFQKEAVPESGICKTHDSKSLVFCKKHDIVICGVCSGDGHQECGGLIPLLEASKSLKLSHVTMQFEKSIKTISGNIQKAIENRNKNMATLKDQKKKIEDEILAIRSKINEQLNKIQDDLTQDLNRTYQKQENDIKECLRTLENGRKTLQYLKEESEEFSKSPTTSVQNFLKTLNMRRRFKDQEQAITDSIKGSKPVVLILKESPNLQSFYNDSVAMGKIDVKQKALISNKDQNDALPKTRNGSSGKTSAKSVAKIKVQFRDNVKRPTGNLSYVKNCAFKSDGQIMFTEPENKLLVVYDKKGTFVTSISLTGNPFDIASINYCTLALTFERQNSVQILDTTYNKIAKTIHTKNMCRGIAYMNGQLFVVVKGEGIMVLDTLGQIKKVLPVNGSDVRFLSASNSRLCFTDQGSNAIHCCDLRGKEIWKFKEIKTVQNPQAIALDADGNAFVVGTIVISSNDDTEPKYNVVVISADGSGSKIVLTRNGRPSGIDYDKKHKRLILYNLDGSADLYDVT